MCNLIIGMPFRKLIRIGIFLLFVVGRKRSIKRICAMYVLVLGIERTTVWSKHVYSRIAKSNLMLEVFLWCVWVCISIWKYYWGFEV